VGLWKPFRVAHAHCDLFCGVYDPAQARIEAESVKAIQERGGTALASVVDVQEKDQVAALTRAALGAYGQIDVLVNNVGDFLGSRPFVRTTWAKQTEPNGRPIALPGTARLEVALLTDTPDVLLSVDGQPGLPVTSRDVLRVARASSRIRLIRDPQKTYFQVLRAKLKWGER